ncbi:MAG: hypothetical protein QOF19_386 [Alphaproteobacteria bacterium]|nr:hypothetical protein [Alphaproteobacteria bacterium]
MGKIVNPIVAGVAALWLLLAACIPFYAQGTSAATTAASDPEYQALFKRMYADPKNLDVSFKFAEVATRLGDYEAAIGALERMLFYNPNLPRVKLELGVLYFRMGGYQMARSYFEQAVATPGVPPEVQTKVNEFLAAINNQTSPSRFGVFLHAGMRYQSNANAGPAGLLVRALGQDAVLNSQFGKAPDWNQFILAGVNHSYDLGGGNAVEASLVAYYAKQLRLSQFDLGLLEVQAGPRFALPQSPFPGTSLKVYGIGTASALAEAAYFSGTGIGVSTRFNVGNAARVEPSYEYRSRKFRNSVTYPTAAEQTSKLQTVAIAGEGALLAGVAWGARVAADWNRTDSFDFAYNSYDRLSGDLGFPIPFSLTWQNTPHQFVFTPSAGVSRTTYLRPNILIDPIVARLDKEWHVGAGLDAQLYANLGFRAQVQYTRTSSSLPNFDLDNFSVSFGPTVRF